MVMHKGHAGPGGQGVAGHFRAREVQEVVQFAAVSLHVDMRQFVLSHDSSPI